MRLWIGKGSGLTFSRDVMRIYRYAQDRLFVMKNQTLQVVIVLNKTTRWI
jgi:hypothetical protein